MTVHNHGSEEGAGLACNESRLLDGSLKGACMQTNLGNVQPKKCTKEECPKTYMPHHWGTKEAGRAGWFMQRNGDAWCPDHVPDWVVEWRAKKNAKDDKQ